MIYPAIDLIGGRCVRLHKGDFNAQTTYDATPLAMAQSFAKAGAQWVHIVDLDGAKDQRAAQSELICQISQSVNIKVQSGGGLRGPEQVKRLLDGGVARVVIGSLAVTDPETVKSWMAVFGAEKFCLAFDVNIDSDGTPRPALKGWTEASDVTLWDSIDAFAGHTPGAVLVTDISKDGVLAGSNTKLYADILARYPDINLITSGGVGTLEDVKALKTLTPYGIIIGKAIYEGRFTVAEAIAC